MVGGETYREGLLNGYRVFFWGDGNILELDKGSGCTTLNVRSATESYTLKWLSLCYMNFTSILKKD